MCQCQIHFPGLSPSVKVYSTDSITIDVVMWCERVNTKYPTMSFCNSMFILHTQLPDSPACHWNKYKLFLSVAIQNYPCQNVDCILMCSLVSQNQKSIGVLNNVTLTLIKLYMQHKNRSMLECWLPSIVIMNLFINCSIAILKKI